MFTEKLVDGTLSATSWRDIPRLDMPCEFSSGLPSPIQTTSLEHHSIYLEGMASVFSPFPFLQEMALAFLKVGVVVP